MISQEISKDTFGPIRRAAQDFSLASGALAVSAIIITAAGHLLQSGHFIYQVIAIIQLLVALSFIPALSLPLMLSAVIQIKESSFPNLSGWKDKTLGLAISMIITLTAWGCLLYWISML